MKKKRNSDDQQKIRTFGFVTGAVLLLAVLTIVLCVMGGVFDFSPGNGVTAGAAATPSAEDAGEAAQPAQAPSPTPTPEPEPTPSPETPQWQISAIAGKGGDLVPSGLVTVDDGESVIFSVIPEEGYTLGELRIDGEAVDAAETYEFGDVEENHSIYAVFRLLPQETEPAETEPPAAVTTPSSPTDVG